jgi:3-hydroxyacyl-CoA dehydrogenase/enoyl-CoA hydratase/3-hydroxybutyryl-CoA epimerase
MTAIEHLVLAQIAHGHYSGRDARSIEAVFEDLTSSTACWRTENKSGPDDLRPTLPRSRLARSRRPASLRARTACFSPVHKCRCRIIATRAPRLGRRYVRGLGKKQGKTVTWSTTVSASTPRASSPVQNGHALAEGAGGGDRQLVDWGYRLGRSRPRQVGIDVGEKVGKIMLEAYGDRMTPPGGMEKLVADKRFGRKNQRGFYVYDKQKRGKGKKQVDASVYSVLGVTPDRQLPAEEIAERCALQMVNEAALCFGEGILRSARDGDIGAIFGLGFPPFRGGPFRWVDATGALEVVRKLEKYEKQFGKRFTPAPILVELARSGDKFYGERAVRLASSGATGVSLPRRV